MHHLLLLHGSIQSPIDCVVSGQGQSVPLSRFEVCTEVSVLGLALWELQSDEVVAVIGRPVVFSV